MPPSRADRALERSRARTEFRKEIVAAGSESQVKVTRERGRQRRSVEKVKTQQRVIERQQSEAARVQAYQQRSDIAVQQKQAQASQRLETQKALAGVSRREQIITGTSRTVTKSSIWSTTVLLVALFFSMIILYVIVTNGSAFGNLAGSAGQWIQGLSSNKPLFVRTS
jgi:cobalamin biosynthesis Mg chelatase CobN